MTLASGLALCSLFSLNFGECTERYVVCLEASGKKTETVFVSISNLFAQKLLGAFRIIPHRTNVEIPCRS